MYAEFLKRSAFEVQEASDGREALAKALTAHPDVIVTETRLPGMSGFELCVLLRTDASTRGIPIVVVTGDAHVADIERAAEAGADAVLTKPCLPDRLAAEIRRLLCQSYELRERARALRAKVDVQLARASDLLDLSHAAAVAARRPILSRSLHRGDTTTPTLAPPALRCPDCDGALQYLHSSIGGVNIKLQEQWDYFECPNACGRFQFRQRTRRLRRVD